jgi:hypothetical protein
MDEWKLLRATRKQQPGI